jgi:hypothetical protein
MDTPVQQVTWAARYGIAQRHWDIIRRYAADRHVYVLIRAGLSTAIPWIERGFPTRPPDLAFLGLEPALGLVVAAGDAERDRVFAHGHYVLTSVAVAGSGAGGPFIGVNPRQPPLGAIFREAWARDGVVIDRRAHRPFTAGYELLAVLGEGDEFHHDQTLESANSAAPPLGWRRGDDPTRGARFVDLVRQELNGVVEAGRVVDATDPHAGAGKGAPGQDRVVVFRPDGRVAMVTAPARAWARMQVGGLMAALRPGRGAESTSRDMP